MFQFLLLLLQVSARQLGVFKVSGPSVDHHVPVVQDGLGMSLPLAPGVHGRLMFDPENAFGCLPFDPYKVHGTVIVVKKGRCAVFDKIKQASVVDAFALVVINDSNDHMVVSPSTAVDANLPVVFISQKEGEAILQQFHLYSKGYIYKFQKATVDTSFFALAALAVGTVVIGSMWSKRDRSDLQAESETFLGFMGILSFITLASCLIAGMFFYIEYMVYVSLAVFALVSSFSMHKCSAALLKLVLPSTSEISYYLCFGNTSFASVLTFFPCYLICLLWIPLRRLDHSWILQDAMNVCVLLFFQKSFKLPNLKVATFLFILAFGYDVFWTLLSHLVFDKAVMDHIIVGGPTGEVLPLLIRMPRFSDELGSAFSFLSISDIALPGLLLGLVHRFDFYKKNSMAVGYFPIALSGFLTGIGFYFAAHVISDSTQSALMFILPNVLGAVYATAVTKGEFTELWNGFTEYQMLPTLGTDDCLEGGEFEIGEEVDE